MVMRHKAIGWAIVLSLILLGAQAALGDSGKGPSLMWVYGGEDESTYWYLYDYDGYVLEEGDVVYIAWAGENGDIDPPIQALGSPYNGLVTGDDLIVRMGGIHDLGGFNVQVTTWQVGDNDSLGNQRHPTPGEKVYARVFDAGDLASVLYFGDSNLYDVTGLYGETFYAQLPNDPDGPTTDTEIVGRFFKVIGGIDPATGQVFALKDSVADLEDGDLVQLIWVGLDGQINEPDSTRMPGGDDVLIETWGVNEEMWPATGTGTFRKFTASFDDPMNGLPAQGDTVYVRLFNAGNILEATHYGNSATYAVNYVIGESLSVFYDDQVDCDMPLVPIGARNFTIYGGLDTTDMSFWPLVDGDGNQLQDGEVVQLIWAGTDALIDPMDGTTGMPTGDDSLLATWGIGYGYTGTNLGRFKYELDTYEVHKGGYPAQGDHIYLRAFDDTVIGITGVATWYGETPAYQVMWVGDEKFYSFPDSNFDATIRTPWFASAEWPEPSASLPTEYTLFQNYPNPFNPDTYIQYQIPQAGWVELTIYNILGQTVYTLVDGHREAGKYTARWFGTDSQGKALSSGIYFYRLRAGDFVDVRKMVLMK
jgi:hypothetical protein